MVESFGGFYRGRRVLVTGDTGFKGSWLCEWLLALGADVHGLGLPPDGYRNTYSDLNLGRRISHAAVDLRDRTATLRHIKELNPSVVFHLAAQSLVRRSYTYPIETLATNVMGTGHVLEAVTAAALGSKEPPVLVIATSDKCYQNDSEHRPPFVEDDTMGGADMYSASKGAAELIIAAWRRSFAGDTRSPIRIASGRAGNVIGGGDWAEDRIVPDAIQALVTGSAVLVRNPDAVRPWQHVLEPLSGYLMLAWLLSSHPEHARGWNFGPNPQSTRTVAELVSRIIKRWSKDATWKAAPDAAGLHEATVLSLSTERAHADLGWLPVWDFDEAVVRTVDWYEIVHDKADAAQATTQQQIQEYEQAASELGLGWTNRSS